jgi:uncharacterized protein (UPF0297 family)
MFAIVLYFLILGGEDRCVVCFPPASNRVQKTERQNILNVLIQKYYSNQQVQGSIQTIVSNNLLK